MNIASTSSKQRNEIFHFIYRCQHTRVMSLNTETNKIFPANYAFNSWDVTILTEFILWEYVAEIDQ